MRKKLLIAVIIIAAILIGGYFAYQKGYLAYYFGEPATPSPTSIEYFFSFDVKNQNLSPETIQIYREKFDEAQTQIQKKPNDINHWLSMAIIKKGIGDYEGAYDILNYANRKWPDNFTVLYNLADLYANFLNQPAKAEEIYKSLMEKQPANVNLRLALAELYRYKIPGKEGEYENVLLAGLKVLPNDGNLIGPLALYYRQTNQIDKAIEYYEKLVQIAPNNETAKEDLAELKRQVGK